MCDKENCGQPHHRLLHYTVNTSNQSNDIQAQRTPIYNTATNVQQLQTKSPPSSCTKESVTHINGSDHKVLLKVIPIRIHGPNGVISSSALLDDGSTVSFIS